MLIRSSVGPVQGAVLDLHVYTLHLPIGRYAWCISGGHTLDAVKRLYGLTGGTRPALSRDDCIMVLCMCVVAGVYI